MCHTYTFLFYLQGVSRKLQNDGHFGNDVIAKKALQDLFLFLSKLSSRTLRISKRSKVEMAIFLGLMVVQPRGDSLFKFHVLWLDIKKSRKRTINPNVSWRHKSKLFAFGWYSFLGNPSNAPLFTRQKTRKVYFQGRRREPTCS